MSKGDLSLGSFTDNEKADVSETERLSFGETGSILAPYSFQPSSTKSDSFSVNSSDDSDYRRLPDLLC